MKTTNDEGMSNMMRSAAALLLAAVTFAASAVPALAVTGRDFGEHIAEHAHEAHFSGETNPGTHTGFAGFEEHHEH